MSLLFSFRVQQTDVSCVRSYLSIVLKSEIVCESYSQKQVDTYFMDHPVHDLKPRMFSSLTTNDRLIIQYQAYNFYLNQYLN